MVSGKKDSGFKNICMKKRMIENTVRHEMETVGREIAGDNANKKTEIAGKTFQGRKNIQVFSKKGTGTCENKIRGRKGKNGESDGQKLGSLGAHQNILRGSQKCAMGL
jgi:hypothetical protein